MGRTKLALPLRTQSNLSRREDNMLISEAIQRIKNYCCNVDAFTGKPINPESTRDKVTYGNIDQECTGIVTCIWPTVQIIERARQLGANLIVTHEAIFWNHGDHQDVVADNSAFKAKKDLLEAWGGAVWRCHDYIHAGVPLEADGSMADGIFYGLAHKLGWLDYRVENRFSCMDYEVPRTSAHELAEHAVCALNLNGVRAVGDLDASVRRIRVPMHIMGSPTDTDAANSIDAKHIDMLLSMEMIDFTTCQYIRDAAMLGQGKCAIQIGHFNLEEPGMEYMATWLPKALGSNSVPISFAPMGDTYQYI